MRGATAAVTAAAAVCWLAAVLGSAEAALADEGLVILEKMENVTAPAARSAKITCRTANLANHKVAWIRRTGAAVLAVQTNRIAPDPRIRVTHENRRTWHLHIDHVRPSDQDWYTCQVNTRNVTEQHAFLEVTVPPDISNDRNMSEVTAFEGENVTLICHASGVPQPNVTWRREDDLPLPVRSPTPVYSIGGARLELGMVRRHFTSDYFCIASNGWPPAVSKRVQLRVNFAPEVRARRRLVGAERGQNVTLECLLEAWPQGLCYWSGPDATAGRWLRRPGELVQDGDRLRVGLLAAAAHYRRRVLLTVVGVTAGDFGRYRCACENPLGEAHDLVELRDQSTISHSDRILNGGTISSGISSSRPPSDPYRRRRPEPDGTTTITRGTGYSGAFQDLVPYTQTQDSGGEEAKAASAAAATGLPHFILLLVIPILPTLLHCPA